MPAVWSPRIAATLFAIFLSLFAMDAFKGDATAGEHAMDLLMHLLPVAFCVVTIILAWKREWLGVLIFLVLAALYAWWARAHPQWVLVISGPLLVVAGLYAWAWWWRRRQPPASS